ncbi:S-adenosyl-L-methionine-dependent methyltransferase [Morchella snyderi]|nr:S-adenosyl-L-methionine-dependent methyltransferase [Morchella snyderi]
MMTSPPEPASEHLNISKLGTKEYWDQAYETESHNFSADPTNEGQIWFDESDAESRILRYLSSQDLPPSTSFLDVGTGNGHLLFELIESGEYDGGAMVGIDYSPRAVELAEKIAIERGVEGRVRFVVGDCVKDELSAAEWVPQNGFGVVLDKGTFDAISLSGEVLDDGSGRRLYEGYAQGVVGVMARGGLLVVTSCNWTEEELKKKLLLNTDLEYYGKISYPSFSFGGKTGQAISSICFRRK